MMANGGVIGPVGVNMAALAAQKHAVPFVVLAGSHKVGFELCLTSLTVDCSQNLT